MTKYLSVWIIGLVAFSIGNNEVLSFAPRLSLVKNQLRSTGQNHHHVLGLLQQQSSKKTVLFAESESSSGGGSSGSSRRRRKRKVTPQPTADSEDVNEPEEELSEGEEESEEEELPEEIELKPREATPVRLVVQDIRQAAGGDAAAATPTASTSSQQVSAAPTSTVQGATTTTTTTSSSSAQTKTFDDSIEMLLQDAREMQEAPLSLSDDSGKEEGAGGVIGKILSTIVTVDFFVVCGLLLWFLAGVFCSYVLRNDTVQIAFNGIFEPVVQPALGVLMIASIASSIFKDESDVEA